PAAEAARTAHAGRDPAPPAEEPGAGEVVPGAARSHLAEVPQQVDRRGGRDPGAAGNSRSTPTTSGRRNWTSDRTNGPSTMRSRPTTRRSTSRASSATWSTTWFGR